MGETHEEETGPGAWVREMEARANRERLREECAVAVMAALVASASGPEEGEDAWSPDVLARMAWEHADALVTAKGN